VTDRARHVVICGGGASAAILVHALTKSAVAPLEITIVEERTAVALRRAIEEERLVIHRGRIAAIEAARATALNVRLKPHGRQVATLGADVVINCTDPDYNPRATRNPFIADLLSKGFARPDPLHLGLDTDDDDVVLGSNGKSQETSAQSTPLRAAGAGKSPPFPRSGNRRRRYRAASPCPKLDTRWLIPFNPY
jgi:uncharacterized NAD(P)/FAD-binding protein YdhS